MAEMPGFLSDEHITLDGTLIDVWDGTRASCPRTNPALRPMTRTNFTFNFRGQKRRNATYQSTTDPDARLCKKGKTVSKLNFMGHVLRENRKV